ncbi:MAG TPA: orotidine-5'-phosphate decarboxylase [Chlamydiales bacterium]|nr:orotidine-5'-phosphate decarboxylase [Chlamydiales bacterium]
MKRIFFHYLFFLVILLIEKPEAYARMFNEDPKIQGVIAQCNEIGVIKWGDFTLKDGSKAPYYIDLRRAISCPALLQKISELMGEKINLASYDSICGVPYAALSLATAISLQCNKPLLMARKEKKDHGTKQMVEGIYQSGNRVLIVEDVINSGTSIMETAATLRNEGLIVQDAIVFLDREQGGISYLKEQGINVHSVFKISELFSYLDRNNLKNREFDKEAARVFASGASEDKKNAAKPTSSKTDSSGCFGITYAERAEITNHPLNRDLLLLMERKQTNLAVAADIPQKQAFLDFADAIGPYICILKMHADIIEDFDDMFIQRLRALSNKHSFFLFEDRKFADIGNTVIMQYEKGVHKIASWAHMINAHVLPGPTIVQALKKSGETHHAGLILIAQLSSLGAYTDETYAKNNLDLACNNTDFVMGFIARKRLLEYPDFLYFTPGVSLSSANDLLGQQYLTPREAILNNGSDIIIVGRGIYESDNIQKTAKQYQREGWNAYLERVKSSLFTKTKSDQ